MNKKGVISIPLVILMLFIAVIILFVSSFIFSEFKDVVSVEPAFNDTLIQGTLDDTQTALFNIDNTIFFLFIGFVIFLIISSYLIRTKIGRASCRERV